MSRWAAVKCTVIRLQNSCSNWFSRCLVDVRRCLPIVRCFENYVKTIVRCIRFLIMLLNWTSWWPVDRKYLWISVFEVDQFEHRSQLWTFAFSTAHWLAIDGQQPMINENPIIQDSIASKSCSASHKKHHGSYQRSQILSAVGETILFHEIDCSFSVGTRNLL